MSGADGEKVIRTPDAPAVIGPYVQARTVTGSGRWIVTSGQIGIDPQTGALVSGGVAAETRRVLENLEAVLRAGRASLADVVKTTVFLVDMDEFQAMNEVYAAAFPDPKPARTTIAALRLPRDARVEIEAWALVP